MQTDLYVTCSVPPSIRTATLIGGLGRLDMQGVLVREWPQPVAFGASELAFRGELLLAWSRHGEQATRWNQLAGEERWRELIHANYDMALDGVCFASAGQGAEIGESAPRFVCLQPHGGSRPLHSRIATWLASEVGGVVIDPFARDRWRPLLPGSIANPDRESRGRQARPHGTKMPAAT